MNGAEKEKEKLGLSAIRPNHKFFEKHSAGLSYSLRIRSSPIAKMNSKMCQTNMTF